MISVIIPTRNRAELLDAALNSLRDQSLQAERFEVLVVDNGSTDNTAAIVESFSARFENVRYLYEPEPGLHAGRHCGMLASQGDVLVFADDDIEALPSWLSSIKDAFLDAEVAMVGGNNLPLFLEDPPAWLLRLWQRDFDGQGRSLPPLSILELKGPTRVFNPYFVWGCNFSIRKDVLLAAGGFHPDGMPRDLIKFRGDGETHVSRYVIEAGRKCVFHPGASVYHKVTPERMTFSYFRNRGFNQGISDSYTTLRDQDTDRQIVRRRFFRSLSKRAWQKAKNVLLFDASAKRALREMRLGHNEGFVYHQQVYREDLVVREWVHKPIYFQEQST